MNSNISKIKGCIFDLDGVIVDTAKYHFVAWRKLANDLGFDFTEKENEKLKGVSRMDSLNLILSWGGVNFSDKIKKDLAAKKNDEYLSYITKMTSEEILPGVVDLLEEVKSLGLKIALGSASKNAVTILKQVNLIPYFDTIIDGTSVTHGKPHPEGFLLAASQMGIEPRECIVFEDAAKGVQAALSGGMYCVGIGNEEDLGNAHLVVPNMKGKKFQDYENAVFATKSI